MKTKPTLLKTLAGMNACSDAQDWVRKEGHKTLRAAWKVCPRGDWMLWFAGKMSGPPESEGRKKLVLAACGCARLALPFAKSPTVLACIETAEAWARGEATIEEVRKARSAAYDAAAVATTFAAEATATAAANAASSDADASFTTAFGAAAWCAAAYANDASTAAANAAASDADASFTTAFGAAAWCAAAYANYASTADAARKLTLARCADIVRKHYPKPPRIAP